MSIFPIRHPRPRAQVRTHSMGFLLLVRHVDDRSWLALRATQPRVGHDRDNLAWLLIRHQVKRDVFANRIFVGPVPLGHGLVDNRHQRSHQIVAIGQIPPAQNRDLHRREIVRRDRGVCGGLLRSSSG
jgi:hypothetical protein